jgi:SAM-dependent methyltransferase
MTGLNGGVGRTPPSAAPAEHALQPDRGREPPRPDPVGYGPRGLAAEYSAKAEAYARLWAPVLGPLAVPLLDELPLRSARCVLDLGTGTGELLPVLRGRAPGARVVGLDRAEGMLRLARADARLAGDAQSLPLASDSLDVALLAFMLFHLPDPDACLAEVLRVLNIGGSIGIVTWGADPEVPGMAIWSRALDAAGARPDPRDPGLMQQSRMDTPAKLAALLAGAGFASIHAMAARFEHPFTVGELIALQLGVGMPGRRIGSLAPAEREACIDQVAGKLDVLPDLVYRPEVVWAVARKP